MDQRLKLQKLLEDILGSRNVYFQPPPTVQLKYPCIIYKRDNVKTQHGDNQPYLKYKRYMVTIIDRNPDSTIPEKVSSLPMCLFSRHFVADNLNHDVYNLYF